MFQQLAKELESALRKVQAKKPNAHIFEVTIHANENNRMSAWVHYREGGLEHFSNMAELERFAITPECTNPILWRKFSL